MQQIKSSHQIPPRQFPKEQYRKQGRRFWIITIGIIVIVLVVTGTFVTAAINYRYTTQPPVKITRPVSKRHSQPVRQRAVAKVTPKYGEHLLGRWLIKLGYPTDQTQYFLNNYQKTNSVKDVQFTKRLIKVDHNAQTSHIKIKRVKKLIKEFK